MSSDEPIIEVRLDDCCDDQPAAEPEPDEPVAAEVIAEAEAAALA